MRYGQPHPSPRRVGPPRVHLGKKERVRQARAICRISRPAVANPDRPPSADGWIHKIKFDGYRIQTRVQEGEVTLKTRKGLD
jgi:ATP-dependent DNA ligase